MIILKMNITWTDVYFKYNPLHIAIVKEIPGAKWSKIEKCWMIPIAHTTVLASIFKHAGEVVMLDGEEFGTHTTSRSTQNASSPFTSLFEYLPVNLRKPVYSALAKVLHPDAGGTTQIMQALNDAKPKGGK